MRAACTRRRAHRLFLGTAALTFVVSAATTVRWGASMSAMGAMAMPGGWTMSMAWMRTPDQSWAGAASLFTEMWTVMMLAMMTPSLVPMLQQYRDSLADEHEGRLAALTAIVAAGYFLVWTLVGVAAFPVGAALAALAMQQPAVARAAPFAAGAVALAAGGAQFSGWKAYHLACCRGSRPRQSTADAIGACRHGLRLGVHCAVECAGFTALLLVVGVMDLRVMTATTVAITIERLAPSGERVSRAIGVGILVAGLLLIRAGLGRIG